MTQKHFKTFGLIAAFAWLAGLMFLFYPLHSDTQGMLNVFQILKQIGDPDGLLGFACIVYGCSLVLMILAFAYKKQAESFFILSTFLPVLFPVIGMLRMNGRLDCDLLYDAYVGTALFFIIIQIVLLVVFCRRSALKQV